MYEGRQKVQPVTAYRRLLDREPIPFISRENIILELRERLNHVFDNHGSTVIIKGESGIGKTRVVTQFLDNLDPGDIIILKARVFGSSSKPFELFSSLLSHYFDFIDHKSKMLTNIIPLEIAPAILSLLPNLRSLYPVEIQNKTYSDLDICSAINQVLESISWLKPIVIFLDDLQLITPRVEKVIQFIHERIGDKALLIIGCVTTSTNNKKGKHRVLCGCKTKVYEINLDTLKPDETGLFINSIFEQDFSPSFNRWMFDITQGNPYFIKEFAKEIVSQNILTFVDKTQKWIIEKNYRSIKVPDSISSIFHDRFSKLDKNALTFLQVASLIGEQFEPTTVSSVLKLNEKEAVKIQARLVQDFFSPVMSTNYVQFIHPVEREILRKSISEREERTLHRKIAKILRKKRSSDYESIARHVTELLLEKEKTPRLCRLVFNVSKRLAVSGDLAGAHKYCSLALDIANIFSKRFCIARDIIEAKLITLTMSLKHTIDDHERASKIANRILGYGMVRLAVHLHIMIYRYIYTQTTFKKAANYISKVIKMIPRIRENESVLFRLKIEQSMVWRYIGKIESARRLIRRLLQKYSLFTDFNAYCYGLNIIGLIYYREGNLKSASRYFKELVNTADELNHVPMKAVALVNLNASISKMGEIGDARDLTQQYQRLILRTGQEYKMSIYWGSLAYCSLFEGNLEDALHYFTKALEQPITIYSEFATSYLKAEVLIHMGQLSKAYRIIKSHPIDLPEPPAQKEWLAYAYTINALYYLKQNAFKKAKGYINIAVEIAQKNSLNIEEGVAFIMKGIIQKANSKKKVGLTHVKYGIKLLKDKGARSYLAPLLCEAGLVFENQKMFEQGMQLLDDIKGYGWIKKFHKQAKHCGFKIQYDYKISAERLGINTFGGLTVVGSGHLGSQTKKHWKSAKARELLGLFIVISEARGATWGEFALHLWPDFGTKTARNNFHFTLSTLRDIIGEKFIVHENNFYRLDKNKFQIDIWDFEDLHTKFKQYRAQKKIHLADQCAKRAIKLMNGDFLPEFHNEAIQAKREDIKHKAEDLLTWLANRCVQRHEYGEATRLAYRLVEKDPINEAAHQIIIKSYMEMGERARALRQYERFAVILKQDFGLEPAIETNRLIEPLKPGK